MQRGGRPAGHVVAVLVGEGDEPHEVEHQQDDVYPRRPGRDRAQRPPPLGEAEPVGQRTPHGHMAGLLEAEELGEQGAGVGSEAGPVQAAGEVLAVDQRDRRGAEEGEQHVETSQAIHDPSCNVLLR